MPVGRRQVQNGYVDTSGNLLLIIERGEKVHIGLAKALTLARHIGARLELFLCEMAPNAAVHRCEADGRLRSEQCLQRGYDYLRALREGIQCTDVSIEGEVVYAASLIQGVADKLQRTHTQMVVRVCSGVDMRAAAFGRQLVNTTGAPLLLTRGRPWRPTPLFVAALNPAHGAPANSRIAKLSEFLQHRCGAEVDYLIANAQTLPGVVTDRDYDLVTVALPRADTAAAQTDAVARLQATAADVLLVPTSPSASVDSRCRRGEAGRCADSARG